ncbi:MAG: DUF559 domain-containing protein [Anaerolineae bacterium]|nr:DUF559 domain-containing protein [Anaerolineae bacterium]
MPDQKKPIRASRPIRQRARELRQEMTPAESKLWDALRNKKLSGLKFRRQHPIDHFIVDFYCAAHKLVVEVDGGIHAKQSERDAERSVFLEQRGYRLIRFRNEQVLDALDAVLAMILAACREL